MAGENNVIGLAMQLDVTDIKAGIKEVNKSIKSSKDEFNNATAGMDKWTKSSEGLNAKLKQLGTQLDGQKKIVAGYEAEIERVKNLEGDHSAELEVLKGKLLNAQTAVKKTQSAMTHYKDTLSELTKKEKEENSTLGKLQKTIAAQKNKQANLTREYKNAVLQYGKNSKEAKSLAKKLKDLSKELDKNESDVKNADKAFENLSKTIGEGAGKAFETSIKAVAKVGAAVTGLVGSFLATAEATRELRTNMGKVDTAFSEAGFSAEQAKDTYTKFYGILGDEGQATEAVSHLAKLSKSQEDLSKWTDIAAGVYGTFGDSLPIENLTEAANETAKTGQLTGGLADALNWAGINEDNFQAKLDACNTEQERQALIQETLTKAYSGASAKYKETNADIIAGQEAQAKLSQAMADVGAQAEPLMTSIKLIGAELLEKLSPVIEKLIPMIQENLPAIGVGIGVVTTALGLLGAAVMAVKIKEAALTAATVAQTIATNAQAIASKVAAAGQWLLNAALTANPIGAIIMAVTALIAIFVTLWKKNEGFRNFWIKMWEQIKASFEPVIASLKASFIAAWDSIKVVWDLAVGYFKMVWDNIKTIFSVVKKVFTGDFKGAWEGIKHIFDNYKKYFQGVIDGIKKIFSGVINIFKTTFESAWNATKKIFSGTADWFGKTFSRASDNMKNAFSKTKSFFSGVRDKITGAFNKIDSMFGGIFSKAWNMTKSAFKNPKEFFKDVMSKIVDAFKNPEKVKEIGINLIKGLWDGIKNMTSWITGKLKEFSGNILGGIKKFFGIHSPSKKMAEVGGYMAEGMAEGIEDGTDNVTEAGEKAGTAFADSFTSNASDGINDGANDVNDSFDALSKTIETQKNRLGSLESQYKSAVLTFGKTSTQAYAVGRQIITLSRELAENESKVKNLDDSYKGLNGTLANQMRVELNNAKNSKKALEEQAESLRKKMNEANKSGFTMTAQGFYSQWLEATAELERQNSTITELTANLNYMVQMQRQANAQLKESAGETPKVLNAYEQLVAKIGEQKKELEGLKTAYESAIINYGATSDQAKELAGKIKNVTDELKSNEQQVKELDDAYNELVIDMNAGSAFQRFITQSKKQLEEWKNGVGAILSEVADIGEKTFSRISDFTSAIMDFGKQQADQRIEEIDLEREALANAKDSELSTVQSNADRQLAIIDAMFSNMEISAQDYRDKRNAIQKELAEQQEKINSDAQKQEEKLAREKDNLARKQFEAQKRTSIAESVINGATAIIKGFAQLGPIGGAINAGIQAVITGAQIATIASQKYVPMLAKGGVVSGATLAMIGEDGKEAVMPLEKNTGWINELASKLSAIMRRDMIGGLQAGTPAYALAGGATTINNYYNQTINSPKALTRREIYRDSKNLLALKG